MMNQKNIQNSPWIIRIIFDKNIMMEKSIIMEDVYMKLMEYDVERIVFTYTDDNSKNLIGRISLRIDNEDKVNGIQNQTDIISIIKNINEDILNNIVIKGIKNISDIVISEIIESEKDKVNYEYINQSKNILETDGVNLISLINNENIDFIKTVSNDIIEIYDLFGIEAARCILMEEVIDVVDHAGEYINSRHIELLCDSMTSKGELTSINRQGINRGDVGPLAKCSFEDTTDQLIKAGIFSEKDNLKGVSSNIMMGQTIKSGTGICSIMMDEEYLLKEIKKSRFT